MFGLYKAEAPANAIAQSGGYGSRIGARAWQRKSAAGARLSGTTLELGAKAHLAPYPPLAAWWARGPHARIRALGVSSFRRRCASIEPGISRFPDAQLRICGLVLQAIPE